MVLNWLRGRIQCVAMFFCTHFDFSKYAQTAERDRHLFLSHIRTGSLVLMETEYTGPLVIEVYSSERSTDFSCMLILPAH